MSYFYVAINLQPVHRSWSNNWPVMPGSRGRYDLDDSQCGRDEAYANIDYSLVVSVLGRQLVKCSWPGFRSSCQKSRSANTGTGVSIRLTDNQRAILDHGGNVPPRKK
jgi:hypothetical protein